jgi:hypothetical protein
MIYSIGRYNERQRIKKAGHETPRKPAAGSAGQSSAEIEQIKF